MSQVTPKDPENSCTKEPVKERHEGLRAAWSNKALGRLVYAIAVHRDRQAFRRFFHRVAPRVKAYAVESGCDETQADTLTRQTMLFAWHRAPEYDPEAESISLWIYKLCAEQRRLQQIN